MNNGDGLHPWAFVAHKDGMLAGVASATLKKSELRKFLGDFAANGFIITTVKSREEYLALVELMEIWKQS